MPNDMVCHVPEGELRVKQSDGMEFVAKKGDVWTCKKGIGEDLENVGSTVAIMRIIDLLPEWTTAEYVPFDLRRCDRKRRRYARDVPRVK